MSKTTVAILSVMMMIAQAAFSQTFPSSSTLDTGLPNIFPTPPQITTGASSTDPLLGENVSGTLAPPSGSGPCPGYPNPPCVLTAQNNNARQDVSLGENVFKTSNLGTFSAHKAQFLVNTSGVPTGIYNPVYSQPLYVSNLTIEGTAYDVLFVVALNGEVYAYNADNLTAPITPLWARDETQGAGMKGLMHNCDVGANGGSSVINPLPYLTFAGVVSTPVIDYKNGILYVVNLCQQNVNPVTPLWWLNAINITTGANYASPVNISYGPTQISANPYGPQQQFSASPQLQRSSLLLVSGVTCKTCSTVYQSVIATFGTSTSETSSKYQGWAFGYDANPSDLTYLTLNYNQNSGGYSANALPYITQCEYPPETGAGGTPACTTPVQPDAQLPNGCGVGGGVWMSARAPAANGKWPYQVFFTAGNGGFNYCPNCNLHCAGSPSKLVQDFTNFGESVLHLDMPTMWSTQPGSSSNVQAPFWPIDYFVPYVVPSGVTGSGAYFKVLNSNDWDMGVSGTLLFDDNWYNSSTEQTVANTSMLLSSSKRGDGYVLLQSDLGQYTTRDSGEVARFNISSGASSGNVNCTAGPGFCDEPRTPAYWNPTGSDGFLVIWPWNENPASFQWTQPVSGSQYTFTSVSTANNPFGSDNTGYAGGALAVTVNPGESPAAAVVRAVAEPYPNPSGSSCHRQNGLGCSGYLLAYSLNGSTGALSSTQIWPSSLPSAPDFAPTPYAIPTAAYGHVYVPAYALCSSFNGSGVCNGSYTVSGVQVYGF